MDGNYLLKTNRLDLSQDEIWHLYMMLTRVENAFRDLKSHLGLRPNFHQIEDRMDGHIFISTLIGCSMSAKWIHRKSVVCQGVLSVTRIVDEK